MAWPKYDEEALVQNEVEMVIQINGKVRDRIMVAVGSDEEALRRQCMQSSRVLEQLEGKTVRKFIVVPGKLVNIVAK
jgi:leucyl-tRNA synthetase